jgi:hypothetical protein
VTVLDHVVELNSTFSAASVETRRLLSEEAVEASRGPWTALASLVITGTKGAISATESIARTANDAFLDSIEKQHFQYFQTEKDQTTHLTRDRSRPDSACSTAAVGFSLSAYPAAIERGWINKSDAADQTLKILNTLYGAPQGESASNTAGAHGFFYHFIDPKTGLRAGRSELSTVDTALLMAGVLCAKNYFTGDTKEEKDIREVADKLYSRVDWNWAMNGKPRMALGWSPESGFIPYEWGGYNEAMVMMLLAMGSPTHAIPKESWQNYTATNNVTEYGGQKYIDFKPLFGHQYTHTWVDFRGIHDDQNRKLGFDYFENSRRATIAQNYYAIKNPQGWRGYGPLNWGWTACDGPKDSSGTVSSDIVKKFGFLGYSARGAPNGIDDGTIAPTAAAASLPFAPHVVLPTLYNWRAKHPELWTSEGFVDAFNPTAMPDKPSGWIAPDRLGIDQGPIMLMTENYRSGLVWNLMKKDPYLKTGLKKAGFTGGWLEKD